MCERYIGKEREKLCVEERKTGRKERETLFVRDKEKEWEERRKRKRGKNWVIKKMGEEREEEGK